MSGNLSGQDPRQLPPGYGINPPPHVAYVPVAPSYLAPSPWGWDTVNGRPFSDKSKVAAGLLQLLPGFFLNIGGIGRLYAGQVGLGVAQLVSTIFAWIAAICGFWLVLPLMVPIATWIWFVVDGIVLLAGRPTDAWGRSLR